MSTVLYCTYVLSMDNLKRSLVSYDDIVPHYDARTPPPHLHASKTIPTKKRKLNKSKSRPVHVSKRAAGFLNQKFPVARTSGQNGCEEDRHYELTRDDIWDDSALIEAWNAANEEYEAYNGPDKGWKKDPVYNSPLWYHTLSTTQAANDSQPFNFDTFVPSYDPALNIPNSLPCSSTDFELEGILSQDEAFNRALSAMYWGGYWTAVYHCQRQVSMQCEHVVNEVTDNDGDDEGGDVD